jgi:hypothetical protein
VIVPLTDWKERYSVNAYSTFTISQ